MDSRITGSRDDLKLPKQRDFLPAKKYREAIKKWGEPNKLLRKRVIIVPSIKCEARDVDIRGGENGRGLLDVNTDGSPSNRTSLVRESFAGESHDPSWDTDSLASQESKYKAWLAERKKLRSILSGSGLSQDWLTRKSSRTALENRVLKRMKSVSKPEIRVEKVLPPVVSEEDSATGIDKGVPTIRQPSPAALAMIQEYLKKRRFRLVDLFAQADKDKNWIVSRDEFRHIIRAAGIPITEADLEDLIMVLDKDNNDALDYMELAVGRQVYLEERMDKKTSMDGKGPNLKIPEPVQEEPEDISNPQTTDRQNTRPNSPQRPSSPHTYSPTIMERPDSSPQRSGTPLSTGSIPRSNSSPTLLGIPPTETTEKVKRPSEDEIKEKRMKKQQKRKEKEKARYKKKPPEKPTIAPSTLGGTTGTIIDRYRNMTLKEYNDTVELCQMHGVQLSKALLGRVLLQPEDKTVVQCISRVRQPGLFTITTRHHVPVTQTQAPGSQRGQRPSRTGPDWVT